MTALAIVVSLGAFLSALAGGILALRAVHLVGPIIALGAGIRIGAAFFDLIPESIEQLGGQVDIAMIAAALGFVAFYTIEKLTSVHVGHETAAELDHGEVAHRHVGTLGAGGMGLHSFLDGFALSAALTVGGGVGLVIAAVVIIHRFSDGIGVVSMVLASRMPRAVAYRWVGIVAIAPVAGVVVGQILPIGEATLGALLGMFAGFFLYIGAAELLPEAHRNDRSRVVVFYTLIGVGSIWLFSFATGALGIHL